MSRGAGRRFSRSALAAGLGGLLAGCGALVPAPAPVDPPYVPVVTERPADTVVSRRDSAPEPRGEPFRLDELMPPKRRSEVRSPVVRVALATAAQSVGLAASGRWNLYDDAGGLVASLDDADRWRAVRGAGAAMRLGPAPEANGRVRTGRITVRPRGGALLMADGKRYRGELVIEPTDSGLVVVNRLPVEEYLRGVVPREIGPRTAAEAAAVEAQAIAARSYTWVRLGESAARGWDVVGGVLNQAYGGADAETPVADAAVAATAGLVLLYDGRPINAPYHAACGGRTASAPELWRSRGEPFLQPMDDTDPATGRPYCAISPRYEWRTRFTPTALQQLAARWLPTYGGAPTGGVGPVHRIEVVERTATGRAAWVAFRTQRGTYRVRANDVRFVLRQPNGELLNSTYFEVADPGTADGTLEVKGRGHGHGVGMCQWGAIGRARAGQDARTILRAYFPGTIVGAAPAVGP